MGTDDPYGPCQSEADCPVADSRCAGSSQTCSPPCMDIGDCPAAMEGNNPLLCTGGQCGISCEATMPCPTGMTCQANIQCTW
jgi:hypothetical protein